MGIAAFVVSVLALVVAGVAALYTKSQRDEVRRQADVAEAADLRLKYGWRIEHVVLHIFVLRNVGWASAMNVAISAPGQMVVLQQNATTVDLAPQQGVAFIFDVEDPTKGLDIVIDWTPRWSAAGEVHDEPARQWREPLPVITARSAKRRPGPLNSE